MASTDANGMRTEYVLDALKRNSSQIKIGVEADAYPAQSNLTTTTTYDAAGRILTRSVTGGSLTMVSSNSYDGAGRLLSATDPSGLVTLYGYGSGGRVSTNILPGGATQVSTNYLDGSSRSSGGTGAIASYMTKGVNPDGSQWTRTYTGPGGPSSPVWSETTTDFLGRTIKTERPGFSANEITENFYDNDGRLKRTSIPGSADRLVTYDALGNQVLNGLDVDGNLALGTNSLDRVTGSDTRYVKLSGIWYRQSSQTVYPYTNSGAVVTNSINRQQLTGLAVSNLRFRSISLDIHGNQTISEQFVDRANQIVTARLKIPSSTGRQEIVTVNGLQMETHDAHGHVMTMEYDELGRSVATVDPRTGTSRTHYTVNHRVGSTEDAAGYRTYFGYDAVGRRVAVTNPAGEVVYTEYNARGEVIRNWGDGTYPVQFAYDDFGRRIKMKTFRAGDCWDHPVWPANTTGPADITQWYYHEATGLLTNKTDALGRSVTYTYGTAGRLLTRTWARGLTTTHTYDSNTGELLTRTYSDATPGITTTYDRMGRPVTVTDAVGTRTFSYNVTLQLATQAVSGVVSSIITRVYDTKDVLGRPLGICLGGDPNDFDYVSTNVFDDVGRVSGLQWWVGANRGDVSYSYMADSDLLAGYSNAKTGFEVSYAYESNRNLRTQVLNRYGATVISQYDYQYDNAGRRTNVANTGIAFATNAYNQYEYNPRGEVIESRRFDTATDTEVGGQFRKYLYDNIGNRETTSNGFNGLNRTWQANAVNQATSINNPSEPLLYDADGNLTNDGTRIYLWDAENRLVEVTPETPVNDDLKIKCDYDYMGRRIRKVVEQYNGSWSVVSTNLYIYDGWNLIEDIRIESSTSTTNLDFWGLDL
ncbi:MAG: hypothetical protein AAF492_07685, partial [Verrucomicrobiota bacterium]